MDNKERFSNRVDTYAKYRPSYPKEAIDYLYDTAGLRQESEIADIGAGTGIFSKLLLERGSRVIAVEPNDAMREEAEKQLGGEPGFRALTGAAEATGLPDRSVDFIVCAQAFHWFDRSAAQAEFSRILKENGKAVLVWNSRLTHGTPFLEEYDRMLRTFGTDYAKVNHKNITKEILYPFFKKDKLCEARFAYRQICGLEELSGRMLSSSYTPLMGHPDYEPMMEELRGVFNRNQENGNVSLEYETELYWGEVDTAG
ncbi:class I SAM-dependent methyltransferase [Paenibacillus harenae]|uniref:class I SAM-dependent methyltransferase n=1 Tax=Paenibacillus harenae TaxID=306543 RepID=UPI000404C762|nr:class I SAM-dependent methyltransferase [Paenibacillus harenae]